MLTPEEQAEFSLLDKEFGTSGGLTPEEQAEFEELDAIYGQAVPLGAPVEPSEGIVQESGATVYPVEDDAEISSQPLSEVPARPDPVSSEQAMSMFDQALEQEEEYLTGLELDKKEDKELRELMDQIRQRIGNQSPMGVMIDRILKKHEDAKNSPDFLGLSPDYIWAKYYNAEYTDPKGVAKKAKQFRDFQNVNVLKKVKDSASGAINSGAFDAEMKALGVTKKFVQTALENISKVETSGGKNNTISSGMAGGYFQVIPSTFKWMLEAGIVGKKSLAYLGKDKEELLSMSNSEIAEYLRDNGKAAGIFGLAAYINKLQTAKRLEGANAG